MLGIAVDPAFTTNRRIYTCYLSNAGTAIDVRVVRWRVTDDWKRAVEPLPIVTGIPVNPARQLGRHSGCRLRFHEGVLWITTGDAAIGSHPQDPQSLAGKVLRVGTDGSPAAGNMGAPFRPEIYAYGFRNPQGLAFRPSDGQAFIIEHGPNRDDEITPLQPGGNGGWDPAIPGNLAGYDESVPMTDTTAFPDALRPAWRSGSPTIAPSGGTFLTNPDWGSYTGRLAVAVLKAQHLRVHAIGADSLSDPGEIVLQDLGRLRAAVEGAKGELFVLTDEIDGEILKVKPIP